MTREPVEEIPDDVLIAMSGLGFIGWIRTWVGFGLYELGFRVLPTPVLQAIHEAIDADDGSVFR